LLTSFAAQGDSRQHGTVISRWKVTALLKNKVSIAAPSNIRLPKPFLS
jgi:hypothetical protein